MKITGIEVQAFRNIQNQKVLFSENSTVFFGENAQGKTNLLEAVFLLAAGKSFRARKLKEMIPTGQTSFHIACQMESETENMDLSMFYSEKEGKKLRINGNECLTEKEFLSHLNIVHFSPDSLSLVKGSPEQRREFLDFAIAQLRPRYFLLRKECARLLTQRNAQLKYIAKNGVGKDMMPVWDTYVSKLFAKITVYRRSYAELLKPKAIRQYEIVSDGRESFNMKYISGAPEDIKEEKDLTDFYLHAMESSLEEDIQNQSTGIGPHRDDLLLFIGGHSAKAFGSQGQQRAAVLALKLAEGELFSEDRGFAPLYLLDDIFSELDESRRRHLMMALQDKQSILTTCEQNGDFLPFSGKKYRVEKGIYTEVI